MEHRTYASANGRDTLTSYHFYSGKAPRAVLQLVHGMAEHLGRYQHFAEYLGDLDIAVCGIDHIGHGKSAASAEDYGYWGKAGCDTMLADLCAFKSTMEREHPGLPYFILGHSMGSFVVRRYMAALTSPPPTGIILSGTGGLPMGASAGILLGQTITALRGDRHRSRLLDRLAFGTYNSRFKDEPTATGWEWLTRELHHVEQYQDDEAAGFMFTVSAQTEMIRMVREVNRPEWFSRVPKALPLLMFSGDMDPVGSYGKGVEQVASGLRQAGLTDFTLRLYPEGRHEMLNEVNRGEVYDDIAQWLEDRI